MRRLAREDGWGETEPTALDASPTPSEGRREAGVEVTAVGTPPQSHSGQERVSLPAPRLAEQTQAWGSQWVHSSSAAPLLICSSSLELWRKLPFHSHHEVTLARAVCMEGNDL